MSLVDDSIKINDAGEFDEWRKQKTVAMRLSRTQREPSGNPAGGHHSVAMATPRLIVGLNRHLILLFLLVVNSVAAVVAVAAGSRPLPGRITTAARLDDFNSIKLIS